MSKTKSTKDPLADLKVSNEEAEAKLEPHTSADVGDTELERLKAELDELDAAEAAAAAEAASAAEQTAEKGRERQQTPPDAPQEDELPLAATPKPSNPVFRVLEDFKGSWGPGTVRLKKGQLFRASRFGGQPGLERLAKAGLRAEFVED